MRRGLLWTLVLLAAGWIGQDVYFHTLHPIAAQVREAAAIRMRDHDVHPITYGQIPAVFRDAVIATEDRRFWSDPGIDPVGIARSLVVDVERDGYVEGGSTLTQQLVDNTILGKEKTLKRKVLQAWYAIGLYDTMSKREVFTLYTNVVYFGHGAYGLYNACETYFGRPPWDCNAGELTLVAGLPNAPSAYDPLKHYALARARQRVVLENMVDDRQLSAAEADAIWREPIGLRAN
ncbi:biosynthetic peptidoglycan transglycosylase [Alicyclobacillus vulcanalis]|uniref:Transglycosylase n=1 Tax=Alicyclobacillus vulcanalis TaxID=252246 RepID=A0A1N7ND65_9BACL|nr:biosynthetic peptidoglycan transglycosylase [Alicyclobacillus vulcanalis]SIS96252.1 Transglycosylase [Alicyclobacillus vulcanalis]